jgi:hypothetical protein
MEPALEFLDGDVVDARLSTPHQPFAVEFPQLVSIRPEPLALGIVVFVLEANRDAVVSKTPERFCEAVVEFSFPFALEKVSNLVTTSQELIPVAPLGVV